MDKDLLKIKISECFSRYDCIVEFDPNLINGWLRVKCSCTVFPEEIARLRELVHVSNIRASIDYSVTPHVPYINIFCCYKDAKL